MKKTLMISVAVAGGLWFLGCASSSEAEREQQQTQTQTQQTEQQQAQAPGGGRGPGPGPGGMPGNAPGDCPMIVEGATVRAESTEGGAALVFTTTGDVQDLRARVARLAEMHNSMHGEGGQLPSTARVEEIEGGARMVLTATNPADTEALRSRVQVRADNARPGVCPMRMGPGPGAATG